MTVVFGFCYDNSFLGGGWRRHCWKFKFYDDLVDGFNPFEKYRTNWIISTAENKEYSKPPPSYLAKFKYFTNLDFPEIRNKGSHFPSKKDFMNKNEVDIFEVAVFCLRRCGVGCLKILSEDV